MSAGVYNITIEQGVDFSNEVQILGNNGLPLDLTGCTFKSQFRRSYSSTDVVGEFTIDVADDPTTGVLSLSLPADTSDQIRLNAGTDFRMVTTKFIYDLIMTQADDTIVRLLQGTVEISPRVTK